MKPVPMVLGQFGRPLGRNHGGLAVAPLGVGRDICPVSELGLARVQPVLVLRVHGDDARSASEDVLEVLLLVYQQVTGTAPHEHLDAADTRSGRGSVRRAHRLLQVGYVVGRGADEESVMVHRAASGRI